MIHKSKLKYRGYVGSDVINVHALHAAILSGNSEEILWLLVVRTALKKGSDVTFFGFLRMNRDDYDG